MTKIVGGLVLSDFDAWQAVNQDFNIADYVYSVVSQKKLSSDLYLAMAELCWPTFLEQDGSVFLAFQFDAAKLAGLRAEDRPKQEVEMWMNVFAVDSLLSNLDAPDAGRVSDHLAKILRAAWEAKLKAEYPKRQFDVRHEAEGDDCLVYFFEEDPS